MQTLLLTGASGFLGERFANLFFQKYNIVGIVNTNQGSAAINNQCIDITNLTQLESFVDTVKPNIILHTAAISSIAACEADIANSEIINVAASKLLAQKAKELKAQFVFTSTDLVFDGSKGDYTETDLPNPLNMYGQQKWEAEKQITEVNNKALILRLPLMVGTNSKSNVGVIADLLNTAAAGKTANLFTDEFRTPLHVNEVSKAIELLIEKNEKGIYHLAGAKKYSRYELGLHLKEKYNLEKVNITATTHAACNITNRPTDVSMNNAKLTQLGFEIDSDL